jgi:hypothetical protein
MNRRAFFRRVRGAASLELSCERLFIRYMEARRQGTVGEFVAALETEARSAGEVRVTSREWLSREDFRRTVAPVLTRITR